MERVASLSSVEDVVNGGKGVISADDSIIIATMQEALRRGRSATFYVSPAQAQAVMRWYWTPGRIKEIGYEPVSEEERAKIESELGIKCVGQWFANRIQCPTCGVVYGMFEFMQQGLREHDRDWIKAVLELKNTSVLRVNPALDAICANCNRLVIVGHWYGMYFDDGTLIYGCCSGGYSSLF
jgi:hypothetical protein